ncbi:hypothetical protein ACHQM5_011801 [Ranunculus cassubicifolius]
MTSDFSENCLLGTSYHWKLYSGKYLEKDVTVKIWDDPCFQDNPYFQHNVENEMYFLHNTLPVLGHCANYIFTAVVFDFASIGTLESKLNDGCFGWTLRFKAALEIAHTISFLHNQEPPLVLRNLEPSHILLDVNFKPVLVDYGFRHTEVYQHLFNSDEFKELHPGHSGTCLTAHDVFDFGSILLAMLAMRPVLDKENKHVVDWANTVGNRENREKMLFHSRLLEGEFVFSDTDSISALALRCVGRSEKRPSMRQIVAALEDIMYLKRSIWRDRGMRHSEDQELLRLKSTADIEECTGCFAADNLLGDLKYFVVHIRLYQGRMKLESDSLTEKEVTVKICKSESFGRDHFEYETMFLTLDGVKSHPNLAKLVGYCEDRKMVAVIYDLAPMCILQKKLADLDYGWLDRVRAILGTAKAVSYLHSQKPPYVLHNLNPANIMLDKQGIPVLVDYGLLTGGIFGKKKLDCNGYFGAPGYEDPYSDDAGTEEDVYSFGAIILALMFARDACDLDDFDSELVDRATEKNSEIIHPVLRSCTGYQEDDARKIIQLARLCVNTNPKLRPAMKKVVRVLDGLSVS